MMTSTDHQREFGRLDQVEPRAPRPSNEVLRLAQAVDLAMQAVLAARWPDEADWTEERIDAARRRVVAQLAGQGARPQMDAAAIAASLRSSVVAVVAGDGAGTGVVLDGEGHILTAAHVVEGARNGTVALAGGRSRWIASVDANQRQDVALLTVEDHAGLVPAPINARPGLSVGSPITAIGNADGAGLTARSGHIKALDRRATFPSGAQSGLIEADALGGLGTSGGPLVDAAGRVVGLVKGGDVAGHGTTYAIPIADALRAVR